MLQSTKTVPRSPRAKLSQRVRVRPYDSCAPEEICVTRNVSRKGLYFETLQGHYFTGMSVRVTRNFHPDDLMGGEEAGDVVRVEGLKTGKWGIAIRFPASFAQASRRIPLFVYGHAANEVPFFGEALTIEINAHGALIAMKTAVPPGGRLLLTNEINQKTQECTVLSVTTRQPWEVEVDVAFASRTTEFWHK